ncbi:MAG TPA: hypothetical protein VGG84_11835 [Gemmatimonadaceae bacterium]
MFRAEMIPVVLGILLALVGLGLLADAWLPEKINVYHRERRRSAREERHPGGEASIGLGTLCIAAAILGRDGWSYSTVAVIAGTLLLLAGAWLNRRYFRDRIVNRGALRRGERPDDRSYEKDAPPPGRPRIR